MGRGSSGGNGRMSGGGVDPKNIVSTEDMISARDGENQAQVDAVLKVAKDMTDKYGNDVAIEGNFQLAELKGKDSNTLGYYDGNGNIAMNKEYMTSPALNEVYDNSAKSGFHPSRGNKSAVEAVAAHEYGHSLTQNVALKMGPPTPTFDEAATRICNEARKTSGHKGNIKLGAAISKYATVSNAETVAEAISDVYCNGKKASKASKAIVKVIDSYLKGK